MNCFSRRSVVVFLLRFGGGRCATSTPRPSLMLSFFSLMLSVSRLDSLFFFLVLALCVCFFYYSSRSRHLHSHLSLFALGFAFFFFPVHVQENDNERESPICGWRHCDCYSSTWIHETLFFFSQRILLDDETVSCSHRATRLFHGPLSLERVYKEWWKAVRPLFFFLTTCCLLFPCSPAFKWCSP